MKTSIPLVAAFVALSLPVIFSPAHAVSDPGGDFLSTHTGPNNPDLDIQEAEAIVQGDRLFLGAALFGDIGQTVGASYVWGIDRGAGTAGLFGGTPPVGPGVTFDAVFVLRPNQTGTLTVFNDVGGPTITNLTQDVFAFEKLVGAILDIDLLPTRGFAPADYRFNLWTRSGGGNVGIADLAQDSGTFGAVVPEPGSWMLMIAGFSLAGWRVRRSSRGSSRRPSACPARLTV